MKTLRGITSFIAVADSGSFAAAARLEGVSPVAVSKNVSTLERHLGVRLLQRSTRKLALTPEGTAFHQQCAGPLRDLAAAQQRAQSSTRALSGLLRVTCVSPIANGYLLPLMQRFHAQHPRVQVELHLEDAVSDLIEGSYDVAVRVGPLADSSLVARQISALPFVLCASAAYLAAQGVPAHLEDLLHRNCIRLRRPGQQAFFPWLVQGLEPALAQKLGGDLVVNTFEAQLVAAELGLGIACLPLPLALRSFRAGRLRPMLSEHVHASLTLCLHYPNRKNLPARTRAFVDFVLAALLSERDLQLPPAQLLAPFV
jgi:DNA-binding transcriptional LysR family regulator